VPVNPSIPGGGSVAQLAGEIVVGVVLPGKGQTNATLATAVMLPAGALAICPLSESPLEIGLAANVLLQ